MAKFGRGHPVSRRKAMRAARTAIESNAQFHRALCALAVEAGGTLRIKNSTFNLLDPEDELEIKHSEDGSVVLVYVPAEEETPSPENVPAVGPQEEEEKTNARD